MATKSKKENTVTQEKPVIYPGSSIRYPTNNGGWRNAVVVSSQDGEVTVLTVENETISFNEDNVRLVNDERTKALSALSETEAQEQRQAYLEAFIEKAKAAADAEAAKRVSENGEPQKRGRKPSEEKASDIVTLSERVIALIKEKEDSPVVKADILSAVPMTAALYNDVMSSVRNSGKIEVVGQKRGTRYVWPGRAYPEPVKKTSTSANKVADPVQVEKVVKFVLSSKEPVSRAMIYENLSLTDGDWAVLRPAVQADSRIEVTGAKRGTRYSAAKAETK